MTTNIGRDDSDPNYRYKMPILKTKVEGSGNGIKTVVTNMVEISKALHIHPAYPTKYFGIELGAQSKFNISTERAIVNGCHQAGDLSKILDRFIQQFILCPTCKLPELKMTIKSTSIKIECAACGHASQIKSAHRLVGYVTKNPPKSFTAESSGQDKKDKKGKKKSADDDDELDEESASVVAAAKAGGSSSAAAAADEADQGGEKKKAKKDKKEKKDRSDETPEERAARKAKKAAKKEKKAAKKAAKKDKKDAASEDEDSSDDEDETAAPAAASSSAPAAETKKAEKKADAGSDEEGEDDEESDDGADGDDWHTDTSKAAVKKRQEAEFAEMLAGARNDVENIMLSAKADNKTDSPVTILKIFLASKTRTPIEISAELRRLAMSRGLDEPQKLKTLLEAIIDITNPKTVVEQFKSKAALLQYFTTQSGASTTATMLLTCIEDLVGVVERKLLPYSPMILKTLYETDVLEEGTLIAWFDAPPEASWLVNKDVAAEVRNKAKPFIDWLREAEEESDEE